MRRAPAAPSRALRTEFCEDLLLAHLPLLLELGVVTASDIRVLLGLDETAPREEATTT